MRSGVTAQAIKQPSTGLVLDVEVARVSFETALGVVHPPSAGAHREDVPVADSVLTVEGIGVRVDAFTQKCRSKLVAVHARQIAPSGVILRASQLWRVEMLRQDVFVVSDAVLFGVHDPIGEAPSAFPIESNRRVIADAGPQLDLSVTGIPQ